MDRSEAITLIARTVHEAIRAYQSARGEDVAPPWPDSGWMQEATRQAVEFALADPTPGAQHDAWVAAKRRDGWSYGATKDASRKTHPSMVEFGALSEAEQRKDALLISLVGAMASVLGVQPVTGRSTR
jgi:hypothetical protein